METDQWPARSVDEVEEQEGPFAVVALWQADFTEVRVGGDKLHVLVMLDDFSRYVVGWALSEAPSSAVSTETLRRAMARHGKPEAMRTDRG